MSESRKSQGDALDRIAKAGTYRTLGEQTLSPAEERFEKGRRTVGLVLAPLVLIVVLLLPLDMEVAQQRLAAALLFVIVLWISRRSRSRSVVCSGSRSSCSSASRRPTT
jgi:sodium-dependent dicarboxylate transporter 2/3/5